MTSTRRTIGGDWLRLDLWLVLKETARVWWSHDPFRIAAALAFYTVLSLVPVLIVATTLAGLVLRDRATADLITGPLEILLGWHGSEAVRRVILEAEMAANPWSRPLFGIVATLIGSTIVFVQLQSALNHIWEVKCEPNRRFMWSLLRDRLLAFAVVLAVGVVLMLSLIANTAIAGLQQWADASPDERSWVWQFVNTVVSFVLIAILFALIYRYLPDVRIAWRDVAIGGAVTSALFAVGKHIIGLYLGRGVWGEVHAADSFLVLLVWIDYNALIYLFGAEFTHVFANRQGSRLVPQEHAVWEHPQASPRQRVSHPGHP